MVNEPPFFHVNHHFSPEKIFLGGFTCSRHRTSISNSKYSACDLELPSSQVFEKHNLSVFSSRINLELVNAWVGNSKFVTTSSL